MVIGGVGGSVLQDPDPTEHSWLIYAGEERDHPSLAGQRDEVQTSVRERINRLSSILYQEAQIDAFVDVWLETYTYYEHHNLESLKRVWYLEDPLIKDHWDTYYYDDSLRIIEWFRQVRFWPSEEWIDWERGFYHYDSSGLLDTLHFQAWYGYWEDAYRIDFDYDESSNLILEIHEGWIPETQTWINAYRESYGFSNGVRDSWLRQSWQVDRWQNNDLYTYEYTPDDLLETTTRQVWSDGTWSNFRRSSLQYTAFQEVSEELVQGYDAGEWQDLSLHSYSFDINEHLSNWLTQHWWLDAWENYFQVEYSWDEHDNLDHWLRQFWTNDHWSDYGRMFYEYEPVTQLDGQSGITQRPTSYDLSAYPNPFNPEVTIRIQIPEPGQLSLTIYDINGRKIRTLAKEHFPSGIQVIQWDGRDDSGEIVDTGVYLCRFQSGTSGNTIKLVYLK